MCMVSATGNEWAKTVPPWTQPWINPPVPNVPMPTIDTVSRAEVEALRREIEELKKLLKAAKDYDRATGQPDCEMDEKVGLIKRLADLVGVDLDDLFDPA